MTIILIILLVIAAIFGPQWWAKKLLHVML